VFESPNREHALSTEPIGLFTSWRVLSRQGDPVVSDTKKTRRKWLWKTLYIYAITLIVITLLSLSFGIEVKLFNLLSSDNLWGIIIGITILTIVLWRGAKLLLRETIPNYLGRQKLGVFELTGETMRITSSLDRTLFSNRLSPELRTAIQTDSTSEDQMKLYLFEGKEDGFTTTIVLCGQRNPELIVRLQSRGELHQDLPVVVEADKSSDEESPGHLFTGHCLYVGEADMVQLMDSIFERIIPSHDVSE